MSEADRAPQAIPGRRAAAIALFALVLGLLVTYAVSHALDNSLRAEAQARFEGAERRLEVDVLRRINQAQYGLRGLAATYASNGDLTPEQFRDWVQARDLPGEFHGVLGFGVIRRVARTNLESFTAQMRKADPDFTVRTGGNQPDLYVVTDIEPRSANLSAYGADVGQEAPRRQAIERAVATGQMALTDRIAVLQDSTRRAGWMMVLPIFRRGEDPATPEARKRALVGVVYARMAAAEVLAEVGNTFAPEVDFRLYDGPVDQSQLLFDSTDPARQPLSTGARNGWDDRELREVRVLGVGGQELTLDVAGTPAIEPAAIVPITAALLGMLLSAALAFSIWQLANARRKAEELAQGMTQDLQRAARGL
ncbi:MAG TPA: CHASE domain-containing protein, partial [Ramlibacter sp.]